jgi:hypothetical protein
LKLTEEDKKYILNEHLKHISCIADKEYQKRVWIYGEGPEVDSFDDTVCDFFTTCDSILENYKDFKVTDNQYKVLKSLRDQFRIFSDENNHPHEFIESPEWGEIIKIAKQVLQEFDYKKIRK